MPGGGRPSAILTQSFIPFFHQKSVGRMVLFLRRPAISASAYFAIILPAREICISIAFYCSHPNSITKHFAKGEPALPRQSVDG